MRLAPCSLLAAVLLCAANARAREPDVHLNWLRPAGSLCPSQAVLEADVEALMEREVFTSESEARVRVRGVVEDDASGVRIHIEAKAASGALLGTRELAAPAGECASVRDALALVLTMFIEYEAAIDEEPEILVGLGAEASIASAPMPRLAWSVGPALSLDVGRVVQVQLSAAYWPEVAIQTTRSTGAEIDALSLELRACARAWAGLGLCAGAESGALMAEPTGLTGRAQQTRLLAHAVVEASWQLELTNKLRAELAAGGLLSLSRPTFSYRRAAGDERLVYQPDLAAVNCRLTIIIPTE